MEKPDLETLDIGQVWVCSASGPVPPLMCIIGAIDRAPDRASVARIVSVHVTPHPEARKAGWSSVDHIPLFEDAFLSGDPRLTRHVVTLGTRFRTGYDIWKTKFDAGKAGVFSISPSAAYEAIMGVIAQQDPA